MSTDLERRLRETLERKQAGITGPMPPNDVPRRARRRQARTVVLGSLLSVVLVAGLATAFATVGEGDRGRRPADRGETTLPTPGPAPGETSLVLGTGSQNRHAWTLRVTSSSAGYSLDFEWDGMGGGGAGIEPFSGSKVFKGYGGSSQLSYPNGDATQPPLPYDISGQVRADAARVALELTDGPVIDAEVFPLPDDLIGPASAFILFVPPETLLVAGDLVAYDASGAELGREPLSLGSVWIPPAAFDELSPEQLAVAHELEMAGAIVDRYYAQRLTYAHLTPEAAAEISTDVTFNTSNVAVPGEVSLRVSGPGELVLASTTPSGDVFSVCFQGGSASVFGRNDTSDPFGCTNGWLDPDAPPLDPPEGRIASGSDENGNLWTMSLVDTGRDLELAFEFGAVGVYKPLGPLGDAAVGSITSVPPQATANDRPVEPTQATAVIGIASADVARVELQATGGSDANVGRPAIVVHGTLYSVPENDTGATQAFAILVPTQDAFTGRVVAFDADDHELASMPISFDPADYADW